jgi:hypothetical protein
MVGYGASLRQARRRGYEATYLQYDSLNQILKEIEELCSARAERLSARLGFDHGQQQQQQVGNVFGDIDKQLKDLFHRFLKELQQESEKVALVTLTKQGQLADAMGALRFGKEAGHISHPTTAVQGPSFKEENIDDDSSFDDDDDDGNEAAFGRFGEEAALLPHLPHRISERSDTLSQPKPIFGETIKAGIIGEWKGENKMDSYTALGVEVLHLLRYICVNAMGIRKILKKHDKLLSRFASVIPVVHDHQLAWEKTAVRNGDRLVGGYDDHIQQLANSNSIAALNASLVSALAGFEQTAIKLQDKLALSDQHTFQRHHRRTQTNPYLSSEMDEEAEFAKLMKGGLPPSSLIRLQCTLWSIRTLREYARIVNEPFNSFLSRGAMILTGHKQLGGLEGTTRHALDILLQFQPDSILFMNESDLRMWQNRSFFQKSVYHGSIMNLGDLELHEDGKDAWGGADGKTMLINLLSILLYTVNYYIVAPTANQYAIYLGTDAAYGATLIGASSFSALFGAFLYSVWSTKASFRSALLFSALCPCIGNLLYALAISYYSMPLALLGRVLVGFGSAEVVNRQLISTCVSFQHMTKACALFVTASAVGMSLGPLIAGFLDAFAGRDRKVDLHLPFMPAGGIVYNHVTAPGIIMFLIWFLQIIMLLFLFSEPSRINSQGYSDSLTQSDEIPLSKGKEQEVTDYGTQSISKSYDIESNQRPAPSLIRRFVDETTKIYRLIFENPALPVRDLDHDIYPCLELFLACPIPTNCSLYLDHVVHILLH